MLKLEIIGCLGNDATVKDFNGKRYIAFDVARSEKFKDAQGNLIERTTWVSVLKPGESNLVQYLKKGTGVYVCGDLNVKIYTDNQRQSRVSVNCLAKEIQFLPGGKKTQSQQMSGAPSVESENKDNVPF